MPLTCHSPHRLSDLVDQRGQLTVFFNASFPDFGRHAGDDSGERVELMRERFSPVGDEPRMLGFLASNVGDHLQAAVANVLASEPQHLEQALFADELSSDSVQQLQPMVREQWRHLLSTLAPQVQKMIDDDDAQGRGRDKRVRVGLYAFHDDMPAGALPTVATPVATPTTAPTTTGPQTLLAAKKSARRSPP